MRHIERVKWRIGVGMVGLLICFSCGSPAPSNSQAKGELPDIVMDPFCGPPSEAPPAPSTCEWVGSLDALVIGRVERLEVSEAPLVLGRSPGNELVDTCDSYLEPYLTIELVVIDDFIGGAPDSLEVRVGHTQVRLWGPSPRGQWGVVDEAYGLVSGMHLGLPLHYSSADGIWSTMGERLFLVDDASRVRFQHAVSYCYEPPPEQLAEAALDAFRAEVSRCGQNTAGLDRKSRVENFWLSSPEHYKAGVCYQ